MRSYWNGHDDEYYDYLPLPNGKYVYNMSSKAYYDYRNETVPFTIIY